MKLYDTRKNDNFSSGTMRIRTLTGLYFAETIAINLLNGVDHGWAFDLYYDCIPSRYEVFGLGLQEKDDILEFKALQRPAVDILKIFA